jgi:hypothetical protein
MREPNRTKEDRSRCIRGSGCKEVRKVVPSLLFPIFLAMEGAQRGISVFRIVRGCARFVSPRAYMWFTSRTPRSQASKLLVPKSRSNGKVSRCSTSKLSYYRGPCSLRSASTSKAANGRAGSPAFLSRRIGSTGISSGLIAPRERGSRN